MSPNTAEGGEEKSAGWARKRVLLAYTVIDS
jgi:hypothetical protein